jgi:hypothetical protein
MRGGHHVYGGQFSLGQFPGSNYGGSSAFNPGPANFARSRTINPGQGFPSSALTNEHWWSFNFPDSVHTPVPSVNFCRGCSPHSPHVNHPHAHASVASMLTSVASLLCPFVHEDSSSASNVSMSFWHTLSAAGRCISSCHVGWGPSSCPCANGLCHFTSKVRWCSGSSPCVYGEWCSVSGPVPIEGGFCLRPHFLLSVVFLLQQLPCPLSEKRSHSSFQQ